MTSDAASELLPPLYARWVEELFEGGLIPREAQSTCDHCAMQPACGEKPDADSYYFDPVIKCCTYLPQLHNFLVGGILSDRDPAAQPGRITVERRMAEGISVTPLGLAPTPVFSLLYQSTWECFGRSEALVCPHYLKESGRCGIWRHRESTCSTWFCKHVRGRVGQDFWINGLHKLFKAVETDLACWCVLELHASADMLRHLVNTGHWRSCSETPTGESLDRRVNQDNYNQLWGQWRGREAEFFIRCAELVTPLSWADILGICGPQARAYAQLTQQAYGRLMASDIPSALKVGPLRMVHIRKGTTRISTYSDYNPLDVPSVVMELLSYFDGRPTADALSAIADERGFRLEPDLIRKMIDFGLLVPPREPLAIP